MLYGPIHKKAAKISHKRKNTSGVINGQETYHLQQIHNKVLMIRLLTQYVSSNASFT